MGTKANCTGILGLIFGHLFHLWDSSHIEDHCLRCGMPKGGWID